MSLAVGAAWIILAVVSPPCRGEQEVPKFRYEITGRACPLPPPNVYIQWWNKKGEVGPGFNAPPNTAVENHRIAGGRRYDPSVVWVTAENASACVKGERRPADPCVGYYYIPCATSVYQLKVTPGVAVEVLRSMRRENDPGRCDVSAPLRRDETFTEGEKITIRVFSADGKVPICNTTVDLQMLGNSTFRDRYDVRDRKWLGPSAPKKKIRRRADNRMKEAVANLAGTASLPDEIEIELTPAAR
jgi:hypothetical protein